MLHHDDGSEFAEAVHAVASNLNIGLHEAVHAVVWRARGQDIGQVVNQEDRVETEISPQRSLDEDDIFALMGPEVFMSINGIPFTNRSVSEDRRIVDILLEKRENPEETKRQIWDQLTTVLSCPHIIRAIQILAVALDDIEAIGVIPGRRIQQMIDPILVNSQYAFGLRERLKDFKIGTRNL